MPWTKVFNIKGQQGSAGPPGPNVVSADAGNLAALGSDGRVFVNRATTDGRYVLKTGDTMTGSLVSTGDLRSGSNAAESVRLGGAGGYKQIVFRAGGLGSWIGTDPGANNALTVVRLNGNGGYQSGIASFSSAGVGFNVRVHLSDAPGVDWVGSSNYQFVLRYPSNGQLASIDHTQMSQLIRAIATSSRRYKEHIADAAEDVPDVALLNPRNYRFSDTTPEIIKGAAKDAEGVRLGLIAEEVAEVDERLVYHDPDGAPLGLDHSALIAALISAVKKQDARIAALEALLPIADTEAD
jgi:hypothetical protein